MANHEFPSRSLWFNLVHQLLHGQIIKDIKKEKEKLISNRELVLKKVENTKSTEKVNDIVFEWLNDVEKLIEEEKEMKIKIETETRSRRLNWIELYNEILKKIKMLNDKSEIEPFSWPIPDLESFSSRNFVCFKSTKKIADQILEALQDNNSYIIGLHGERGSGKTKLVKAVGEKAKYLKIFNAVVFVTVSQNPDIRGIQDQIADSLNMNFDKHSNTGRAKNISLTLSKSNERILVILDDVWAKLELKLIGIPRKGNSGKVLLTTRLQPVCTSMECHREIQLHPLSEEEAWTLLKKYSNIDDLLNVAREVTSECKRLPGIIKDVGSSLKNKPIEEWKASLERLKHSTARYQIFLSFRGEDTRYSFTGSLYNALCQGGFKTFMDEEGLQSGDQISESLIKAIEESRLSIVVLSKNYAHSSWCLEELVSILECMKKKDHLVWPIFYKVNPSHIRYQKDSYGKAMVKHEKLYGKDSEKVKKWRSALSEVSHLVGKTYGTGTGYEHEFIQKIVDDANNIKKNLHI